MPVYLVAAAQALIYLSAVPVCAVAFVTTEGGLRFGVGVSAFEWRYALRRARAPKRRGRKPPGGALARRTLAGLRLEALALSGRLGLGDAAATALACGAIQALGAALGARAEHVALDVAPDFGPEPRAELRCMIRARTGQIMIAAARGQFRHGRIKGWTGTPLKV